MFLAQKMHFLQNVFQMNTIALVSVINPYHINGLHLYLSLYIYIYIYVCVCVCACVLVEEIFWKEDMKSTVYVFSTTRLKFKLVNTLLYRIVSPVGGD